MSILLSVFLDSSLSLLVALGALASTDGLFCEGSVASSGTRSEAGVLRSAGWRCFCWVERSKALSNPENGLSWLLAF